MSDTPNPSQTQDQEAIYEAAYKAIIEQRLNDLEQRLEYLEQNLEVRKREYDHD